MEGGKRQCRLPESDVDAGPLSIALYGHVPPQKGTIYMQLWSKTEVADICRFSSPGRRFENSFQKSDRLVRNGG